MNFFVFFVGCFFYSDKKFWSISVLTNFFFCKNKEIFTDFRLFLISDFQNVNFDLCCFFISADYLVSIITGCISHKLCRRIAELSISIVLMHRFMI